MMRGGVRAPGSTVKSRTYLDLLHTPEVHLALACLRRLYDRADTLSCAEIISIKRRAESGQWLSSRLSRFE